ncbi:electron transfer flavoprotein subunit alpha/FixB family protein [Nesterenkonia populi]
MSMATSGISQVLVLLDRVNESLTGAQAELLTIAERLGDVSVVSGASAEAAAGPLSVKGVREVYVGEGEILPPDVALVDLLETAVKESGASVILGTDTPDAVDALARLAVRLDAGLITSATGLDTDGTVTKSVLAGERTTVSRAAEGPLIATVKPNIVEALLEGGAAPEVTALPVKPAPGFEVLETAELPKSGRPPLAEARVVVAAGRGVDGDLTLVEELADELGAAIGASRAATDAGWVHHSAQVGQTGVTVSPQLYISVGISGAIQQKAGMQTADVIVAINKDEDAPVFEIADYGVVGDLNDVLPQMVEELRARKG